MRSAVALLLLANLLFFGWARGWLAAVAPPPQHGQREPGRLGAQVRPEAITLLSPQAASAALAATRTACLEAGPLDEAEAAAAQAVLLDAGIAANLWTLLPATPAPPVWLVYLGRYPSPATLKAREDELRRLKLPFEPVSAPPELAPGLALSRHGSREAADSALAAVPATAALGAARVVALPPAPQQRWLRAARADPALQARLLALQPPQIAAAFSVCASR